MTDTIKFGLTASTYSQNLDTHDFYNDITNEVSGGNYAQITLSSKTATYDTATNETRLDCADPQWTNVTFTTAKGFNYKDTGVTTTSPLMGFFDFGGDQSPSAANFTLTVDSTGLLKITS